MVTCKRFELCIGVWYIANCMLSLPRTAALALLPIPLVYAADQFLKSQNGKFGLPWNTHYVERPIALVMVGLLSLLVFALYCRSRLMALGAAFICGGALGNLNDIAKQGFAWNMFPVPGVDLYFNLADCFVLIGAMLSVCGIVLMLAEYSKRDLPA